MIRRRRRRQQQQHPSRLWPPQPERGLEQQNRSQCIRFEEMYGLWSLFKHGERWIWTKNNYDENTNIHQHPPGSTTAWVVFVEPFAILKHLQLMGGGSVVLTVLILQFPKQKIRWMSCSHDWAKCQDLEDHQIPSNSGFSSWWVFTSFTSIL